MSTPTVERVRRRFDAAAQRALDLAIARRVLAEAQADLEAAKAAREPREAALYVLALRRLVAKPELVLAPRCAPEDEERVRVFGGVR